jgi:ribosomal protein S18 acetylase RimI-like enzyme
MPFTSEELLTAVEENPEGIWELYLSHLPGATYKRDEKMRLMCSQIPVSFFNGIAVTRLKEEECDEILSQAINEMMATGMPWSYQVGPNCKPDDLELRLDQLGLKFSYEQPYMTRSLVGWQPAPLPKSFEIREVDDVEAYKAFIKVGGPAFGLPDFVLDAFIAAQTAVGFAKDCAIRNFIGEENGTPVATGTVFYGAGLAGIYTIGTLPEARGKGYGGAMTEACMAHAAGKGVETAFLQSSKMGYSVYQRLGFQEVCRFKIYIPGP